MAEKFLDQLTMPEVNPDEVCVVSGSVDPELAGQIAGHMGLEESPVDRIKFPNTERYARYEESVRGKHVFIVQSTAAGNGLTTNDALVELGLMIGAAHTSSAKEVTAIIPYFGYGRQERKAKGREPISSQWALNALAVGGLKRAVTLDIHEPAIQGSFNNPFDLVTAGSVIEDAIAQEMATNPDEEFIMVAPDGGRASQNQDHARELGIGYIVLDKDRLRDDMGRPEFIEHVEGKTCVIVDDEIDTAGTLLSATKALSRSGSKRNIACATHLIFSSPAHKNLKHKSVSKIIGTNSVPLKQKAAKALEGKLDIHDISYLLAVTAGQIATEGSVSAVFQGRNHR